MSNDEARKIVQSGLDRRREKQRIAERESKLELYERDQIRFCNEHHENAKLQRMMAETGRFNREQIRAKRIAMEEAAALECEMECKSIDAVKKYIMICMAMFCLTIFTNLPVWAAATFAVGSGVFPAAYIYRLYAGLEK